MELVDVLKKLATIRGTTLAHEISRHNVGIMEQRREWAANGKAVALRERRRAGSTAEGLQEARC